MTTDQILREVFAAHEHLVPDADETLRAIHERIDGEHGVTRIASHRRPILAGIGVAATVVAVVAASLLIPGHHHPATPNQVGTHDTSPTATATATATATVHGSTGPATLASMDWLTVAATYLPPGQVTQVLGANGTFEQVRNYMVRDGWTSTSVGITIQPGQGLSSGGGPGGKGIDQRVNGAPARQWTRTGWSQLVIARGQSAVTVNVKRTGASSATISALARRVAGKLVYNRHDLLHPEFGLGYVPAGENAALVQVDNHGATMYVLTVQPGNLLPDVAVASTTTAPKVTTTPGRSVQGHPTRVSLKYREPGEPAVPILEIENAVHGHLVVVYGGSGASTLAELYKIGDGLLLPS